MHPRNAPPIQPTGSFRVTTPPGGDQADEMAADDAGGSSSPSSPAIDGGCQLQGSVITALPVTLPVTGRKSWRLVPDQGRQSKQR